MVICCGRLVVVSLIPPGDLFFVFWANLLFFGAGERAARDFGPPEKTTDGYISIGPKNIPKRQKSRFWLLALKTTRFEMAPRALGGAFLGVRADSSRRT